MKILQVCARFAPYIGGTETAALEISKELVARGHDVTVVCANEPAVGSDTVEGIQVVRLPYLFKIANTNICPGLLANLLTQPCDIIHGCLPHPYFVDLAALAARIRRKPFFLTYHNDTCGTRPFTSFLAYTHNVLFLPFIMKASSAVFVDSDTYVTRSKWLSVYRKKIIVNPLGVDSRRFYRDPAIPKLPKSIFFLSVLDEFHRYKGLDLLLNAFARLTRKVPEARLYIGGEGVLRNEYVRQCRDLGVGDTVTFLGRLSDQDVFTWYNRSELFVLPTLDNSQEGFGLAPLEAMACGCRVVTSNVPAIAVDLKAENVFTAGDGEACTNALLKTFACTGDDADRLHAKYSWQKHVNTILDTYAQATKTDR